MKNGEISIIIKVAVGTVLVIFFLHVICSNVSCVNR